MDKVNQTILTELRADAVPATFVTDATGQVLIGSMGCALGIGSAEIALAVWCQTVNARNEPMILRLLASSLLIGVVSAFAQGPPQVQVRGLLESDVVHVGGIVHAAVEVKLPPGLHVNFQPATGQIPHPYQFEFGTTGRHHPSRNGLSGRHQPHARVVREAVGCLRGDFFHRRRSGS